VILIQYSQGFLWEEVEDIIKALKSCFPGSSVSSYRAGQASKSL
jgi:hypothetical protein